VSKEKSSRAATKVDAPAMGNRSARRRNTRVDEKNRMNEQENPRVEENS
jgi:hypothetical protein